MLEVLEALGKAHSDIACMEIHLFHSRFGEFGPLFTAALGGS